MGKIILSSKEIRDRVIKAIDIIADPVVSSLCPKGSNVLFETDKGEHMLTNDGITIARSISVSDPLENSIIEIVKGASLRTNNEAGDGTTTSILLSRVLTKEGLRLIDNGESWIEIRDKFNAMGDSLKKRITQKRIDVKGDEDLKNIAKISSNNDDIIAQHILNVVKVAKEDGMVFLEPSNNSETEIVKDLGYMVRSGIPHQEFAPEGQFTVTYKDVPVLITDKKIYYPEEAEGILRTAIEAGHKSIVIIATDVIGEAVNIFIANHQQGVINVLFIKQGSSSFPLQDLASYLGGKVISEKTGNLVGDLTAKDFIIAKQVFADPRKTLITPQVTASKELKERIKSIKSELKKDPDNESLKQRLSSLTTGIVTIKIGGNTPVEVRERIFRYEDALNATRSAMKHGYLVGGGLSLLNAFNPKDYDVEMLPIAKKYTEAVIRQIADNCGKHQDTIIENVKGNHGYNALTDEYEDLLKAGVIDPYQVIKLSIDNSISVANTLISIKNYVLVDRESYDKERNRNKKDSSTD